MKKDLICVFNLSSRMFFFLVLFIIFSCSKRSVKTGYSGISMVGTYINGSLPNLKLEIYKDSTFFFHDTNKQEHLPISNCKDSLSWGLWDLDIERKLILLNSATPKFMECSLTEKETKNDDTITVLVNTGLYLANNNVSKEISFKLSIYSNKYGYVFRKSQFSNRFEIPATEKTNELNKIYLEVIPTHEYSKHVVNQADPIEIDVCEVTKTGSNSFEINIPSLTDCYINSLDLNNDFVKIINESQLEWDGHIYTKQ